MGAVKSDQAPLFELSRGSTSGAQQRKLLRAIEILYREDLSTTTGQRTVSSDDVWEIDCAGMRRHKYDTV